MTNRQVPTKRGVMELACFFRRMPVKATELAPRTAANHEADELAKGITTKFDPAKRIDFNASRVAVGYSARSAFEVS